MDHAVIKTSTKTVSRCSIMWAIEETTSPFYLPNCPITEQYFVHMTFVYSVSSL